MMSKRFSLLEQVEKFDTLNWIYNEGFPGGFVEVSAKEDENVEDIFRLLLDQQRGGARYTGPLALQLRRRSANSLDESEPVSRLILLSVGLSVCLSVCLSIFLSLKLLLNQQRGGAVDQLTP